MYDHGIRHEYVPLILSLKNEQLYSVADLIEKAQGLGIIEASSPEQGEELFHSLLHLISLRNFSTEGDAVGSITRKNPIPVWFGLRWKTAVTKPKSSENRIFAA